MSEENLDGSIILSFYRAGKNWLRQNLDLPIWGYPKFVDAAFNAKMQARIIEESQAKDMKHATEAEVIPGAFKSQATSFRPPSQVVPTSPDRSVFPSTPSFLGEEDSRRVEEIENQNVNSEPSPIKEAPSNDPRVESGDDSPA